MGIEKIIGRVPVEVVQTADEIEMRFSDGSVASWFHSQDCCETVEVNDVVGQWESLYGHPLLVAEERTSEGDTGWGHETWTFYVFRNLGGSVDVRWHGESNGYYSESVEFFLAEPKEDPNA